MGFEPRVENKEVGKARSLLRRMRSQYPRENPCRQAIRETSRPRTAMARSIVLFHG